MEEGKAVKRRSVIGMVIATALSAAGPGWAQVTVSITGSGTPVRGLSASYVAEALPTGTVVESFDWKLLWAGGLAGTFFENDADGDRKSAWGGRMVVDGTLYCTVTVAGTPYYGQLAVSVTPRSWPVPLSCATDNESDWGPAPTAGVQLGESRDRDSDLPYIFVPQSNGNWDSANTYTSVSSGPCQGLWYVAGSALKAQRETVINRYIKQDGPTLGGWNFYDINNYLGCLTPSSAAFVTAIGNHEYRGTPATAKSTEGHYGRLEKAVLDDGYDAKQHIEPIVASSLTSLRIKVRTAISADEYAVRTYADSETDMTACGPNWGPDDPGSMGYGANSRWDENSSTWTDCVNGPEKF